MRVLDEQATAGVRRLIGERLTRSRTADFALSRIRLAALDLSPREIQGPERCRVVLGTLDAASLLDRGPGQSSVEGLLRWLDSGRLLVRSAGIGAWTPDFSVFSTPSGERSALLGAHYFASAPITTGPSFTAVIDDEVSARRLAHRFEETWERAHDVAPAIRGVLERSLSGS